MKLIVQIELPDELMERLREAMKERPGLINRILTHHFTAEIVLELLMQDTDFSPTVEINPKRKQHLPQKSDMTH